MQIQTLDSLSDLFTKMLRYRESMADMASLGPWLQHQLCACQMPCLTHLPLKPAAYTRNCVAQEAAENRSDALFEALVMRWDAQARTSIHGHPKFSFYHVISGLFEIETFESIAQGKDRRLELKEVQQFGATQSTWFLGQAKRYDNCIHRVTCLMPGFTFHVYSEDALKGEVYGCDEAHTATRKSVVQKLLK